MTEYGTFAEPGTIVFRRVRLGDKRDALTSVAAGWHTHLGILADRLRGADTQPFWAVHSQREAEYAQRIPE